MITRDEGAGTNEMARSGAATGIVRSGGMFWAAAAGLVVVASHAATVPMDAWLPVSVDGGAVGPAFLTPLSPGEYWTFYAQTALASALAGLPWPSRFGWAPLLLTAIAVVVMSRTFRRLGLPGLPSALLALVATSSPLLWAQATTPFGAAVVTAGSSALALVAVRGVGPSRTLAATSLLGGAAVWALYGVTGAGALSGIVSEVSSAGLVLAAVGLLGGRRAGGWAGWPIGALGATAWALVSPLGAVAQVAAALPFVWTLVAAGILTLLEWRGRAASTRGMAWVALGLVAWTSIQAFGRPWTPRHELTTLARQWARAAADATVDAPLLTDATAASGLVEAWLRGTPAFDARVALDRLPHTPSSPRGRWTMLPALADAGRWLGLAPTASPVPLASIAEVADGLPPNVVVAVAVSLDAAARLTPGARQALTALGSRVGPGGAPRARALVGFAGGRAAGGESAAAPQTSLVLLPGDLIGQTGRPSPLDLRLEADAHEVRLFERDRLRVAAPGVVVAVYRRTGARLALWTGADTQSLTAGVPGTDGPVVRYIREVLPCRDVPAGTAADLTTLAVDGALGVQARPGTRIRVSTAWADGHPSAAPQIVDDPRHVSDADAVLEATADGTPFGITLRGRPATVRWQADAPARVCQAPPIQLVTRAGTTSEVEVHPRAEHAFGGGWHDIEPMGGDRYFRWMAGPRAVLLLALAPSDAPPGAVTLTLDAQSVGAPGPADRLRLAVNGTWLDARALAPGRGLQTWTLPGALLRPGLNEILVDTTLTLRPSDVRSGTDGRMLGLAVYGWRLAADGADAPQGAAPRVP